MSDKKTVTLEIDAKFAQYLFEMAKQSPKGVQALILDDMLDLASQLNEQLKNKEATED